MSEKDFSVFQTQDGFVLKELGSSLGALLWAFVPVLPGKTCINHLKSVKRD